ncbi:MAG TPA: hypothetical protein VGM39_18105 [Kofleriaceae bacterium]
MAVWAGAAIVAAVLFGPTGLPPHTVTLMMRESIGAALVVGGTWLLLFVPIARVIVRADAARFLRSLPHSSTKLLAVRVLALVGLQLPWIALWVAGEIVTRPRDEAAAGVGGPSVALLAIAATTILAVAISRWRPAMRVRRNPQWTSSSRAFAAIYAAALFRRASDALVRGAGLALLAGLAAGLFVHNNKLVGVDAAKLAGIIATLALVPAQLGVLSPLLDAHRSSAWLAASSGVSPSTRAFSLARAIGVVYFLAALIASVGFVLVVLSTVGEPSTSALIACIPVGATLLGCAIASALAATAIVLRAATARMAATQLVTNSLLVAVGIAVALATMSVPVGPFAALLATGALLATRAERSVDASDIIEVRA